MPSTSVRTFTVYLLHSRPLLREGVRALFARHPTLRLIGDDSDPANAVREIRAAKPDVVLMELYVRGESSLSLLPKIRASDGSPAVFILSDSPDPVVDRKAAEGGATGIINGYATPEDLVDVILASGDVSASRRNAEANARQISGASNWDAVLTAREREIALLATTGLRNREIALRLFISEGTVRRHLAAVFRKLGLSSRVQLALARERLESCPLRCERAEVGKVNRTK